VLSLTLPAVSGVEGAVALGLPATAGTQLAAALRRRRAWLAPSRA
jgi:hypothetical protein